MTFLPSRPLLPDPDEKEQCVMEIVQEVFAGFPSPGENWRERPLHLQDLLIQHPDATFYVRVKGHSMRDSGILHGDVLVVDRALEAQSGDIVVVVLSGKHLVKRLEYVGASRNQILLCSAHPAYPPVLIQEDVKVEIWGVVIAVVRQMRRRIRLHGEPGERS
jgi:DNA polymerase V